MRWAILATAGLLISLDVVATINIAAMHGQTSCAGQLIDTEQMLALSGRRRGGISSSTAAVRLQFS